MVLRFESGPPADVSCALDWTQGELRCVLRSAGAQPTRRAQAWAGPGSCAGHGGPADPLAGVARALAFKLRRSARMPVRCEISIVEGEQVLDALHATVERAARTIEESRIRAELEQGGGWHRRIRAAAGPLEERFARFLARPFEQLLDEHGPRAARIHAESFGGRVQLFAPLYLSNACQNDCSYCGFRRSASFRRRHLSPSEAQEQARALAAAGHRSLDLVAGEVPTDAIVAGIAEVVRRIRAQTPIRDVRLNVGALSRAQFGALRRAGASACHLYQESYDPELYLLHHRSGPKREMAHRLAGPARILESGFAAVGLGVLLGLGPLAGELAALAAHARLLEREHPGLRLGFSLPRWRAVDDACGFAPSHAVDDDRLAAAFLLLRLEFPRAGLSLSTREGPALRERLLPLGITRLSAGVSTAPGGYTDSPGTAQFALADTRSLAEVEASVRALGLWPVLEPPCAR